MTAVGVPGVDVPDHRGRTGLDRAGRDLTGNPGIVVRDVELLASGWHVLRRTTLERRRSSVVRRSTCQPLASSSTSRTTTSGFPVRSRPTWSSPVRPR